jgi:hypothetical protein
MAKGHPFGDATAMEKSVPQGSSREKGADVSQAPSDPYNPRNGITGGDYSSIPTDQRKAPPIHIDKKQI